MKNHKTLISVLVFAGACHSAPTECNGAPALGTAAATVDAAYACLLEHAPTLADSLRLASDRERMHVNMVTLEALATTDHPPHARP